MDTVSSDIKDDFKIKAIDDKAVHKICSGQVVLTLANAVKELFENSLDAGSSFIEIRLKEYGSDTIEIIDNGCGIQESNFQALTLKHYTSKLTNFEDLVDVQTYGFRGEALSSLCALSDVTITTRHSEVSVGTKLEFDHDGHIVKKTMISRQVGTTVTVKNLFNTLPVRHKEFNKNIKREFSKMLNCLYAYCLVSENIRILCSNQTNRSKSILISSPQKSQLCDKISNIFGSKQSTNLLEIITCFPTTDVLDEYGLKEYEVVTSDLSINGYVSSCEHGLGRSSADRQFYFINKRPCDLPKLSKLINAIYHSYNRHQFPFIILNINLKKQLVDVNVTPDKRMLLFDKENVLFAVVKASFQKVFESKNGNFDRVLPSLLQSTMDSHTFEIQNIEKSVDDSNTNLESKPEDNIRAKDIKELPATLLSSKINGNLTKVALGLSGFKRSGESLCSSKQKVRSLDNYFNLKSKTNTMEVNSEQSIAVTQMNLISTETCSLNDLPGFCVESSENQETIVCEENIFNQNECDVKVIEDQEDKNLNCLSNEVDSGSICENNLLNNRTRREGKGSIAFSMTFLKKYFRGTGEKSAITINCRKFKAKIEPGSNEVAENELKNELNKDMFKKMSIIGQFNLGFIITKYDNDLFIVDQHATDEKYNYEDLKKNVVLDTQRLITPMSLNLSAANEIILDENLGIFVKNGFVFSHTKGDEQNLNKICLVGVPVSKNWTFGKEDIEEMLFMMSDGVNTGEMYRPSRIQQMLASRACRKSVMIGTALTAGIMKKLVYHMAEMDQPWNCPHGRPTIRHLINLECIQTM